MVSVSPQARASLAVKYKLDADTAQRKITSLFKSHLGADYVFDTTFSRNFSLIENSREFIDRYKRRNEEKTLPMLASACPGWICYAEKTHGPLLLPYISTAKSPQQVMGSLVKDHFRKLLNNSDPNSIYHVSVMPCFDKKLEASRPDFYDEAYNTRDVDLVITSGEIETLLQEKNIRLDELVDAELDPLFNRTVGVYKHAGGDTITPRIQVQDVNGASTYQLLTTMN